MPNQPAGFALRFLAWADEYLLRLLPSLYILSTVTAATTLPSFFHGIITLIVFAIFFGLALLIYNLAFTYYLSGVIGKQLTGLAVLSNLGTRLTFKRVLFRQLLSYRFSGIIFGLGYLSILKDSEKRAWHDKTVDSNVYISRPLFPIGILALVALLYFNFHFIQLSIAHFNGGPLKGEIVGLWSNFQNGDKELKSQADLAISQPILSDQKNIYSLLSQKKINEASQSAQLMLNSSKTQGEKALSLQVTGEVLAANNDYTDAKPYFLQALAINDNLPGAHIGVASADITMKQFQTAIENAQRAIDLDPSRTDYYDVLGIAYFGAGQKDKAIESIKKAIAGNPNVDQYKKDLDAIQSTTPQSSTTGKTVTQAASAPSSGLGYTSSDAQQLINEMGQDDQSAKTLEESYRSATYNQKVVDLYLSYVSQRKAIAQQLLNKMGKGEPLTQDDLTAWGNYKAMGMGENYLYQTLANGNGGY